MRKGFADREEEDEGKSYSSGAFSQWLLFGTY